MGERPAARLHAASVVITHGLELPERANALEIANVRAVRQVHAVHVGVDKGEGERRHATLMALPSTSTVSSLSAMTMLFQLAFMVLRFSGEQGPGDVTASGSR